MRFRCLCAGVPARVVFVLVVFLAAGLAVGADEQQWFRYLGNKTAPKSPRKGMNAAEATAPLPLPATPLRRNERKKPPQPDYLIGKVIWGQAASFTDSSGSTMQIADWNLCPTDVEKVTDAARQMDLAYHWTSVNLDGFHWDSKKLPALLFSGTRTLRISDTNVQKLREYVLGGGMVICDSIAGSPYFYDSAKSTFLKAFPECSWRTLPMDHPLYHIFSDVATAKYGRGGAGDQPYLEAIYVGSRVGVLLSKYGLGCGWNGDLSGVSQIPEATYYDVESATKIGANLAGYIVGYAEVGLVEGRPEVFGLSDQKPATDEFVFAQLKHDGAWNVHPGAATALLVKLKKNTSVRVNLQRRSVNPETDDLSGYPFLYITGLDDFSLSQKAVDSLRQYLRLGGVLVANNGLGLSTFDAAFRRELGKVLPGTQLQEIPQGHPLYRSLFTIDKVAYSPAVSGDVRGGAAGPLLLGVNIDGELRVIYSPYDMEAGWLAVYYPLMKGYEPTSAQELGMNVVTYAITH
jgi:hypothetical protein